MIRVAPHVEDHEVGGHIAAVPAMPVVETLPSPFADLSPHQPVVGDVIEHLKHENRHSALPDEEDQTRRPGEECNHSNQERH